MKTLMLLLISLTMVGCASGDKKRTRWTDKSMRIAIDPDALRAEDHVSIQRSLVQSGKWHVIDRAKAYKAIKAEQDRLHREEPGRFDDREKFALWGRLLGVGGIVQATATCTQHYTWSYNIYSRCQQNIAIFDTNTGEVIAAITHVEEGEPGDSRFAMSWENAVEKFNDAYPQEFEEFKTSKRLESYRDVASEEAKRARESEGK